MALLERWALSNRKAIFGLALLAGLAAARAWAGDPACGPDCCRGCCPLGCCGLCP